MSVAIVGDHIDTSGMGGITIDGARPDGWETGNFTHGISVARGDLIVTPVTEGTITVISGHQRQLLLPPEPSIEQIATSPRSHFVVAQYHSKLFVWDLDDLLPRRIQAREDSFEMLDAPPHHVLAVYPASKSSEWIDLASGRRTPGPTMSPVVSESAPSGANAVVTGYDGEISLLQRGRTELVRLAANARTATFVDDGHVALSAAGAVQLVDIATRATSPLANVDAMWLIAAGDWLLAGDPHDTVTRIHRGTPEVTTRKRPKRHKRAPEAALTADGRAWLVEGTHVECWRPDGTIATHASLPEDISHIYRLDDHHLFVRTVSSDTYVIDLDEPNRYRASTRLGPMFVVAGGVAAGHHDARTMSIGAPLSEAGVVVTEPAIGASRRVARLIDHNDLLGVSADGRYLFSETPSFLQIWEIGLPGSPDDTAALLDRMTNATVDRSGTLAWP